MSKKLVDYLPNNGSSEYFTVRWLFQAPSGKTAVYEVTDKERTVILGYIKWWGAWRKYCFFPESKTVFDLHCLKAMATTLEFLTAQHYNRVKA